MDPDAAWRGMIAAWRALERAEDQPGLLTALSQARAPCLAAAFPVEGEGAKATAAALLELARTYPRTGEDHRGWRRTTLGALCDEAEALLDQHAYALAARFRPQEA